MYQKWRFLVLSTERNAFIAFPIHLQLFQFNLVGMCVVYCDIGGHGAITNDDTMTGCCQYARPS